MLLESELVSGIDLCGNGIIVLPGTNIRRAGEPNAYPDSRLVRNIYSGNTSLVARVFLSRPNFTSVNEIVEEINNRNGEITQPTVSKALQQLQKDLIVSKEKKNIRLLALVELASEFAATGNKLILAGGYGLYLKQLQMQLSAERTLINSNNWPQPRSTIDLDIFLETELVTSLDQMQALRSIIDKLGYSVIEKAKFMHFARGEKSNAKELFNSSTPS